MDRDPLYQSWRRVNRAPAVIMLVIFCASILWALGVGLIAFLGGFFRDFTYHFFH
jgi:hypothetical protein